MKAPPLGPIVTTRCCREWPVFIHWQIRRCGLCGEVPVIDAEEVSAHQP